MDLRLFPKPPEHVGTYPSAFLGVRSWRVSRTGEPLRAAFFGASAWTPGVTRAECDHCPRVPNTVWDDSDATSHRCGLHAYHSVDHLIGEQKADLAQLATGDQVIGIVAGKGNFETHAAGWRSEEAQILGLLAPPRPWLYVCPYCEGSRVLRDGCRGCRSMGVVAGAADEEGLIRVDVDHEAARERIDDVAAHHGVRVFDSAEEMMEFGRSLAPPVPEELRVPRTPIWATDWFGNGALLGWLLGLVATAVTISLLLVGSVETILEEGRHGMIVVGPTLLFGEIAVLGGLIGVGARGLENVLKHRASRAWACFGAASG